MAEVSTEELISHLYNEVSATRRDAIHKALQVDAELMETHQGLSETMQELSNVAYSPRKESIERILQYGQST